MQKNPIAHGLLLISLPIVLDSLWPWCLCSVINMYQFQWTVLSGAKASPWQSVLWFIFTESAPPWRNWGSSEKGNIHLLTLLCWMCFDGFKYKNKFLVLLLLLVQTFPFYCEVWQPKATSCLKMHLISSILLVLMKVDGWTNRCSCCRSMTCNRKTLNCSAR